MFPQICPPCSTVRSGLFSFPATPSKVNIPTPEGPRKNAIFLRFRGSTNAKKLDETGNSKVDMFRRRSDGGGNFCRFFAKADSGIPLERPSSSSSSLSRRESSWEGFKNGVKVFYRFTKPYVILAKIIEVLSMSLFAIDNLSDFSPTYFSGVLKALFVTLLLSIYIGGLNQLTDIDIDKINKPNRPLASGQYSYKTGSLIVASCAILSFGIAWVEGSWPLFILVLDKLFFGTLYSVDVSSVLKWKRSAFLSSLCMMTSMGLIPPGTYYLHFQTHLLRKTYSFPKSLIFTSVLMGFYYMILSLAKDIPDVEGDAKYGIESFTMRFGHKRVFWFCVTLLELLYLAAICVGAMSSNPWSKLVMILGHGVMAAVLWDRAKRTDLMSQSATEAFYVFLWKLLCAEYLLSPFVRF